MRNTIATTETRLHSKSKKRCKPEKEEMEIRLYVQASEQIITSKVLRKPGYFSRSLSSETSEVQELGMTVDEVLYKNEEYFSVIIAREPWHQLTCGSDFRKITKEVLKPDDETYSWTQVAMLLALAVKLSQLFYENGANKRFVTDFSRHVGMCIWDRVKQDKKGISWEELRRRAEARQSSKPYLQLFGMGAVVVSFVATVANFSMSSGVFLSKLRP